MTDIARQAADLLIAVRAKASPKITNLPEALRPADRPQAYAIQRLVVETFTGIGGWKVGAAGPEAPPQCAVMPLEDVRPSPATAVSKDSVRGIEAEVAFRMAADLPPRATPYTRDEVIAAIGTAHPVIELLDSRYVDPDTVDAFTSLADCQVHGGFVYGPGKTDWHGIDFSAETVEQYVDGTLTKTHIGNPVGDMIRLMVWMANEGAVWAGGLKAGQFVTCGSWTGKEMVGPAAKVRVFYPSLGEVRVNYV